MKVVTYVVIGLIGLFMVVLFIGFCLPSISSHTKKTEFKANIQEVFNTVINNEEWKYRKSLDNLKIISTNNGVEEWEETSKGTVIKFKTIEKRPYTLYSFKMEGSLFTASWTGEFEAKNDNTTSFKATEYIVYRNSLTRIIGYLFLDLDSQMEIYQEELREKVEQ